MSDHPVKETFWVGSDFDVFHVRLRWGEPWKHRDGKPGWVDFEVFEVVVMGTETEDVRWFHRKGYTSCPGEETLNADEAETVAEGFVKWDGCTQWDVSSAHTDSTASMRNLCDAIQLARSRAIEVMGAEEYA